MSTKTDAELDETLEMLAEMHDIDLPYVDVVFDEPVWHEDGSSSWRKVPEGIWGVRTPTLDGRDAIVGSTFKRFPAEWQVTMRCRHHVPYRTLGPAAPVTDSEPF